MRGGISFTGFREGERDTEQRSFDCSMCHCCSTSQHMHGFKQFIQASSLVNYAAQRQENEQE